MISDIQKEVSFQALLAHAGRIAKDVKAQAIRIQLERSIPKSIVDDLIEHGFFKLIIPPSVGGHDLELDQFHKILSVFSRVDASVGWCINQNNVFATNFAKASAQAQREVWENPRTVISNGPAASGTRATVTAGGYRLSGEWSFSSGITHANWVAAVSPVFEPDASKPNATLHFLIPINSVRVKDDWFTGGLCGTGSQSFAVSDHFIPSHLAFDASSTPENPTRYTAISTTPLFAMGFATVATSVATEAMAIAVGTAREKIPFGADTEMCNDPTVQRSIGIAMSKLISAQGNLSSTAGQIWENSESLKPIQRDARIAARMASTHAIQESAEATHLAYQLCGSHAIYMTHPIQRRFQDAHTITQQVQGRMSNYDTVGQFVFGMEPKGVY